VRLTRSLGPRTLLYFFGLGLGYKRRVGIPAACSGRSGLILAVDMLNIYDIMFAHDVPVYVATRK